MHEYLSPGRFIDSDHPSVVEFAEKHRGSRRDPLEQAINLYYAVREAVRYNPYTFSRDPDTLRGSYALAAGESYCVPKATLLAGAPGIAGFPRGSVWRTCAIICRRRDCSSCSRATCSPCTAIRSCI